MKRVCIIRHSYYPEVPPVRRNAETLTSEGYDVCIICSRKSGQQKNQVINGVRVYRLPIEHRRGGTLRYMYEYLAFFFLAFWKLNWLHLRKRFETVEVDGMPDFLVFATVVSKLTGVKVIFNLLDSVPLMYIDKFKSGSNHPVIRILELVEKASMHYADHVIFPGSNMREKFAESRGLAIGKTSVILNVPDENIFHPHSDPSKPSGHSFHLVTHGSLLEKYGIQTLIKATPLLIPHIPELRVSIIGEGEYRPSLEHLVKSFGLENRICFTGFVPMEEIPSLISQADIGVVCLLIHMLPTKLFEYVALGKPVISTDFPSTKKYFNNAVMYYEPGDEEGLGRCILDMYRRPEIRTHLATLGFMAYQKYRWDTTKFEYLRIFDDLNKRKDIPATPSEV